MKHRLIFHKETKMIFFMERHKRILKYVLVYWKKSNYINCQTASKLFQRSFSWDQINLLVYGPDRPYFKEKQKKNITKFWASTIYLIYYILLFEKRKKKETEQTHISNQNQDELIILWQIINYKLINKITLRGVFFCVCHAKHYFQKNTNPKIR